MFRRQKTARTMTSQTKKDQESDQDGQFSEDSSVLYEAKWLPDAKILTVIHIDEDELEIYYNDKEFFAVITSPTSSKTIPLERDGYVEWEDDEHRWWFRTWQ